MAYREHTEVTQHTYFTIKWVLFELVSQEIEWLATHMHRQQTNSI